MTTPEPDDTPPPVVPDTGQQPVPPQHNPAGPPYGPPPYWAPPPVKKGFWQSTPGVLVAVAVVVLLLCCGLGRIGRGSDRGSDRSSAGDLQVEITSCEFTGGDLPTGKVGYRVTNNGSSTESARVRIEYRDSSGDRIDTDTAYVRSIAPGDTVRGEESTLLDAPVTSGRCIITGVE